MGTRNMGVTPLKRMYTVVKYDACVTVTCKSLARIRYAGLIKAELTTPELATGSKPPDVRD
jgi:hypothetical protein